MSEITSLLVDDHRHGDSLLAKLEEGLNGDNSEQQHSAWQALGGDLTRHFDTEESILFPAMETAMGGPVGPISVMRSEHEQMRALLEELGDAIEAGDTETALGATDTLVILIQQHNLKEESILYPMANQALAQQASTLADAISNGLANQ